MEKPGPPPESEREAYEIERQEAAQPPKPPDWDTDLQPSEDEPAEEGGLGSEEMTPEERAALEEQVRRERYGDPPYTEE